MSNKTNLNIQNKIKVFRAEHDLTQEGLAQAIGVTRATINSIEKGKYTPSLELAFKIALHFKTKIEKVFYIPETEGEKDEQ
jgi:putative transcriptional regulator